MAEGKVDRMLDHRDDKGINLMLSLEERQYFLGIILTAYPSSGRFKRALVNMDDGQLMAFANDLIKRGKIRTTRPSITVRAIKFVIGASHWTQDVNQSGYVIYFGQLVGGKMFQTGWIQTNKDSFVTECWLFGERVKRFEGMELLIY